MSQAPSIGHRAHREPPSKTGRKLLKVRPFPVGTRMGKSVGMDIHKPISQRAATVILSHVAEKSNGISPLIQGVIMIPKAHSLKSEAHLLWDFRPLPLLIRHFLLYNRCCCAKTMTVRGVLTC